MVEDAFSHLADLHALGDDPVPAIVVDLAAGAGVELVWRNELGGLTFRFADRYLKWNPRRTGIDLERELQPATSTSATSPSATAGPTSPSRR